jgi:hypothetical protein
MVNAHFAFETSGFSDSPEVIAQNVNGIAGRALANWLAGALKAGFDVSEVWPEDHGWDFSVSHGGARYLCACSIEDGEGAGPREGHVSLAKSRSLGDRLLGRKLYQPDDAVTDAIRQALSGSPDVARLEVELI